ncbi:SHOCT domain-containing protein [Oceanobacillus alkalisoli]|uniref:SHOCT domain-containing protein n=1 Tax=Oceanobacillus alkalisoli TaxID=2925113 RepID=UPI001EF07227|nr:SHOCT domain-containing protein [Oceanobacillus alkalisoli]MCF3944813.1 SHOCT domain-containing protein [Oceanobacillus alkalisoli]MCG5104735.1 SHOCT domain-containing protein [Oceanobacillus alkalisoli]
MPEAMIIRLIVTAVVLVIIVVILIRFRNGHSPEADPSDSLDIMKRRYEEGEITKEDYEEAKRRRGKK